MLQREDPFTTSSIHRIRLSKMQSAPATHLEVYRVDFSTTVLMHQAKSGIRTVDRSADLNQGDTRSAWIASSILDHALPEMVAAYRQRRQLAHNGDFQMSEPVCIQTLLPP
jgi:hypothetical protein